MYFLWGYTFINHFSETNFILWKKIPNIKFFRRKYIDNEFSFWQSFNHFPMTATFRISTSYINFCDHFFPIKNKAKTQTAFTVKWFFYINKRSSRTPTLLYSEYVIKKQKLKKCLASVMYIQWSSEEQTNLDSLKNIEICISSKQWILLSILFSSHWML
jgi:hypothetical protein